MSLTTNSEKEGRAKGVDMTLFMMMIVLVAHHFMFNTTLLHFLPRFGPLILEIEI